MKYFHNQNYRSYHNYRGSGSGGDGGGSNGVGGCGVTKTLSSSSPQQLMKSKKSPKIISNTLPANTSSMISRMMAANEIGTLCSSCSCCCLAANSVCNNPNINTITNTNSINATNNSNSLSVAQNLNNINGNSSMISGSIVSGSTTPSLASSPNSMNTVITSANAGNTNCLNTEQESTSNLMELFNLYRQLGNLAFTLGDEMVTTLQVDDIVKDSNQTQSKQNQTNQALRQLIETNSNEEFRDCIETIDARIKQMRYECYNENQSFMDRSDFLEKIDIDVIERNSSDDSESDNESDVDGTSLRDKHRLRMNCVEIYERSFSMIDSIFFQENQKLGEKFSKTLWIDFAIRNVPYSLFIRGVVNRFTALGLGWNLLREENFDEMHRLLENLFNEKSLSRINLEMKKKNAETIERLRMINGTQTEFVAVPDANQIPIQIGIDFLESFGLKRIEMLLIRTSETKDHLFSRLNLTELYRKMLHNQIRYLIRVQDFLNISIYSHLTQLSFTEQNNFIYHLVVVLMLLFSVLLSLILFSCNSVCSSYLRNWCCLLIGDNQNAILVSSSSKRTFAGGIINRYCATPINNDGSSTGTALLSYKFENSRNRLENRNRSIKSIELDSLDSSKSPKKNRNSLGKKLNFLNTSTFLSARFRRSRSNQDIRNENLETIDDFEQSEQSNCKTRDESTALTLLLDKRSANKFAEIENCSSPPSTATVTLEIDGNRK
ncbi:hypothetical protein NH340_JMT07956 [Sarcoptes scabiei]|nr:hypothetical protein NH340_JMT07956 [Sarcoptes scabiei]